MAAALVVAAWSLLCAAIVWRQARRRARQAADAQAMAGGHQPPVLIAYASQTGFGEQLARQSARLLQTGGLPVVVRPLGLVTPAELAAAERVLLIVSTYGEGDPPDNAARFADTAMTANVALPQLHHGVLALGDSSYANFCGFGRRVDEWLRTSGSTAMFDHIEVDNDDVEALRRWQHEVARLAGTSDLPDWRAPAFETWRLVERRLLNAGSQGGPMFHLELEPADDAPLPEWQAGDLIQLRAPSDPGKPREYTISSLPRDGRMQLLVRQERRVDGSLGCASGWITAGVSVGDTVELRLRAHSSFRIGDNTERALILIGNGTGWAGLRAHLKARAAMRSPQPVWLLLGERQSAHDNLHADEIGAWQTSGVLAHADLVFSRDQPERRYVQHALTEHAERLRAWVSEGAAIYVCGSLQGMAFEVNAALQGVLGSDELARLSDAQRYRRDVY